MPFRETGDGVREAEKGRDRSHAAVRFQPKTSICLTHMKLWSIMHIVESTVVLPNLETQAPSFVLL